MDALTVIPHHHGKGKNRDFIYFGSLYFYVSVVLLGRLFDGNKPEAVAGGVCFRGLWKSGSRVGRNGAGKAVFNLNEKEVSFFKRAD